MSNAESFLNAYARIEKRMNILCHTTRYTPFNQLLDKCIHHKIISMNFQNLREYHELRNAIVHMRGKDTEIIAEPSDSVTRDIERIADLLEEDDNIMNYVSKHVKCLASNDTIIHAYEIMSSLQTSKLPIYDDGEFKGILTIEEIAKWAINGKEKELIKDILTSKKNERVLFLSSTSSVQNAIRAFEKSLNTGYILLAIIVTKKGNTHEAPLGILTVADLAKILKHFA